MEFKPFPKVARWSRGIVITEKIDGTNASVCITPDHARSDAAREIIARLDTPDGTWVLRAGSRTRWITPQDDNYGFAAWVAEHSGELFGLGEGHHFGEWWGRGIQRSYMMAYRRFSLFNAGRWADHSRCELDGQQRPPECCDVVPALYRGPNKQIAIDKALEQLHALGSVAAPGFMKPEGIMIFHTASGELFKKTLERDAAPKSVLQSQVAG